MKQKLFGFILFGFLSVVWTSNVYAFNVDQQINQMKGFSYEQTTRLEGMKKYATDKAGEYVQETLKGQMKGWVKEIQGNFLKEHGNLIGGKYMMPAIGMQGVQKAQQFRNYLKSELANRIQVEIPRHIDGFLKNKVFQGADMAPDVVAEMQKMTGMVTDQVTSKVGDLVKGSVDRWGGCSG